MNVMKNNLQLVIVNRRKIELTNEKNLVLKISQRSQPIRIQKVSNYKFYTILTMNAFLKLVEKNFKFFTQDVTNIEKKASFEFFVIKVRNLVIIMQMKNAV